MTLARIQPFGAVTAKCPSPITSWVYPLKSAAPSLSDNVVPGQTFDVSVPTSAGTHLHVVLSGQDILRELCSERMPDGNRLVLMKALSVGTSYLTISVESPATLNFYGHVNVDPAPPPTVWPKHFTAGLVGAARSAPKPVAYGTLVPRSDLPRRPAISLHGSYGYALTIVRGFQYAIKTVNGGKAWRIASTWFAGPWADGAAFAGLIHTFSSSTAVADGDGQLLYITTDAGRHWYGLFFSGVVLRVSLKSSRTFIAYLGTEDGVGRGRTYASGDGGVHWSLLDSNKTKSPRG